MEHYWWPQLPGRRSRSVAMPAQASGRSVADPSRRTLVVRCSHGSLGAVAGPNWRSVDPNEATKSACREVRQWASNAAAGEHPRQVTVPTHAKRTRWPAAVRIRRTPGDVISACHPCCDGLRNYRCGTLCDSMVHLVVTNTDS